MHPLTNRFKHALGQDTTQLGLWLGLADPYAGELCATAGFDWLLIDGEHAPNDLRSVLATLQALAAYSSHPVVRIPKTDTALIKQVLELGVTTLLVPMVETAEQAAATVQAMRYPPAGVRGVGFGLARSSRWNGNPNYLQQANDHMCLLAQVESVQALDNLDAIAQVDGVDGIFIGPADLAASMGYLGQTEHPTVRAAIERAIGQVQAAGKAVGILATDTAYARQCIAQGVRFIAIGVDTTLLAQATRNLLASFQSPNTNGAQVQPGAY